eukprot:Nitzschia sp. Nitz4//scaffold86_size83305//2958//4889//NITZ4_005247-RA/size83305-processed-gene-0.91-mRNA-1//-1//CDS//3329559205//6937//frame0
MRQRWAPRLAALQVGLLLFSLVRTNEAFLILRGSSRFPFQSKTLGLKGPTAAARVRATTDPISMGYSNDASVETVSPSQHFEAPLHTTVNYSNSLSPLRVMFFIDGTWLYYSLFGNKVDSSRDPINRKLGKDWQASYKVDWKSLPMCVMRALQKEDSNRGWQLSSTEGQTMAASRPLEIVRACVYTATRPDTHKMTARFRMFEDMRKAGYDVTMLQSDGENEKCVDIQLAVDMVHYATIPNTFDIAVIISGDKDYIPALVRCRQKGRRVAVASVRSFCSRAFWEMTNVRDYDVVWLDDYTDDFLIPHDDSGDSISKGFIAKVIKDFVLNSGMPSVSIRDIGRYLKRVDIGDRSLLDQIKKVHFGLHFFLRKSPAFAFVSSDQDSNVRVVTGATLEEPKWNAKEEMVLQELSKLDFSVKTTLYAYTLGIEQEVAGVDNSHVVGGAISVGFITAVIEDFILQSGMSSIAIRDIGRYIKEIWVGQKNVQSEVKEVHHGLRQFLLRSPNFDLDSRGSTQNTFVQRQLGVTVDDRAEWSDTEREVFEGLPMDLHLKLETYYEFTLEHAKQTPAHQTDLNSSITVEHAKQTPAHQTDLNSLTVKDLKEMCRQRNLPVSGKKVDLVSRLGGTGDGTSSRETLSGQNPRPF